MTLSHPPSDLHTPPLCGSPHSALAGKPVLDIPCSQVIGAHCKTVSPRRDCVGFPSELQVKLDPGLSHCHWNWIILCFTLLFINSVLVCESPKWLSFD